MTPFLILLLPRLAFGAAVVEIGGQTGYEPGEDAAFTGGLDVTAGSSVHPRWDVGLAVVSGMATGGSPWARAGTQARAFASPDEDRPYRPYLIAGAGIGVTSPLQPAAWIGPGLLAGDAGHVGWRVEARLVTQWATSGQRHADTRVELGLGLHLRARRPVRVAPAPVVEISPPEALIWLPHPWCAWVKAEELPALLASVPPEAEIVVTADGRLPAVVRVTPGADLQVRLDEAPHQGALVILTDPADTIRIEDHALALGKDGTLLANLPEGPVTLEVTGGGRTLRQELAVAEGWATWLRVPPPGPQTVLFPIDSSRLDAAARAQVAVLASRRGSWRYRLEGSWSTEGEEERNTSLGRNRAEAVRDALLAAGVPSEALVVGPPTPPPVGPPQPGQRVCRIVPLPPEAP